MGIQLVTPVSLEPITMAEAKANANDDGTENDAWLWPLLISAARARAEQYMEAAIMRRTITQTVDAFPEAEIEFEVLPAWNKMDAATVACPLAVTAVQYVDAAGTTQTLAASAYTLDKAKWPFWLLPAVSTEWPATREQADAVLITVQLGYATQAEVPAAIRHWMLATTAFLFAQREAFVIGGSRVGEIPNRYIDAALDPYRQWKV